MEYRVTVQPSGISFDVKSDETILEAALRCGFFFPHKCRMGVCTSCKGKILQGEIEYRNEILGLSEEEKANQSALFCCAKPKSDLTIFVKDFNFTGAQISPPKTLIYSVIHSELLAKNISRVLLKAPAGDCIQYQAGQYVKVIHSDQRVSPMSIASPPADLSIIELHLSHPPENSQAVDLLQLIKTQSELSLQGSFGVCTVSRIAIDRPILFLANGTGFSSVKAVIEELITMKEFPPIHFYWYGKSQEELYMQELVHSWMSKVNNFRFTPVVAEDINQLVLQDYPDLTHYQVYMVDAQNAVYASLFQFMHHGLAKEFFYSDVI